MQLFLTAVLILSCHSSRYEELRYWYDCLCYEEDLRKYHDYMDAMEEIEDHGVPHRHHEVPLLPSKSSLVDRIVQNLESFHPLPQGSVLGMNI